MRVAVVIPALNCDKTIAEVVRAAREVVPLVVVVDDGSTDGTSARAAEAGATVLSHATCQGKGAALLTGFRALVSRGVTHVLTMDGDGQHLASEIPEVLGVAEANPQALVVGQRRLDGVEVAPLKLFGNRFANRWVEIASGQRLPDTQSGFRAYPVAATLALGVRSRRFSFETEVLIRAARAGIPILSTPVTAYYPPAAERTSHFRPFLDTVRIIAVVVGLILRVW